MQQAPHWFLSKARLGFICHGCLQRVCWHQERYGYRVDLNEHECSASYKLCEVVAITSFLGTKSGLLHVLKWLSLSFINRNQFCRWKILCCPWYSRLVKCWLCSSLSEQSSFPTGHGKSVFATAAEGFNPRTKFMVQGLTCRVYLPIQRLLFSNSICKVSL